MVEQIAVNDKVVGSNPTPGAVFRQGFRTAMAMFYVYIIWSSKSSNFYFGYTEDLKKRFTDHNDGKVFATKPYTPWNLVFYCAFDNIKLAKDFERYLKSGSGKAFAYKRLLRSEALKKDKIRRSIGTTKLDRPKF